MRKTANYELNQWDPGDRILREEFNGDNERIDAAITAARDMVSYVRILDVVTEKEAQQIDVDMSGIDFTQYHKMELFLEAPSLAGGYSLRVNGLTSGYAYMQTSGSGSGETNYTDRLFSVGPYSRGVQLFYPPRAQDKVGCVYFYAVEGGYTGWQVLDPCTWAELRTLNLFGYQTTFPAGCRITMFGVKK